MFQEDDFIASSASGDEKEDAEWSRGDDGKVPDSMLLLKKMLDIPSETLLDGSHRMTDCIGVGDRAFVTRCIDVRTGKMGATKMFHDNRRCRKLAEKEISIVRQLQRVDSSYIVQYSKHFWQKSNICINFELLDQTLLDYLWARPEGLPMVQLRSIIWQMAGALTHLKAAGIVHADLRPGNVMVVDAREEAARIKLIDFGTAFYADSPSAGPDLGTSGYRAPEIILGMPLSGAVDVWSLGASAVYLATSDALFRASGDEAELREIISSVGQPSDDLLDSGPLTSLYFHKQSNEQKRWRLKSPLIFEEEGGQQARTRKSIRLDDVPELMVHGDTNEKNLFVDLVKKTMQPNADKRIGSLEVLQHPFLTNSCCQVPEGSRRTEGALNTEAKPGSGDGGEDRSSRLPSRISRWIRRIELCFTCLHQQSVGNTPQKSKRAANSGHEHRKRALYQCPLRRARNS